MISWLIDTYGPEQAEVMDAWRETIWNPPDELREATGWNGFQPTPMQEVFLLDPVRFKMVAGGVRAGKSQSPPRACDWFTGIDGGLIWIVGPDYTQARNEFKYLMEPYMKLGLVDKKRVSMPQEGMWSFEVTGGARVETKSGADLTKVAGEAPVCMLVTEVGQHTGGDNGIVDKAQERALEKYAPVIFSGTFEGAFAWYPEKWDEWKDGVETYPGSGIIGFKSYSLPTWSNTYVFPLGADDPRFAELRANTPNDVYLERIEAIPFKPSGLVFRDDYSYETHVTDEDLYIPGKPVELAIDPAHHTYAILFVQRDKDTVRVLDEVYRHDVITQDMFPLVMQSPYWPMVTGGVIDVAGKQQQANYSVVDLWSRHMRIQLRSQSVKIIDGINAVKLRLKEDPATKRPRLLISRRLSRSRHNDGRAGGLLSELEMYSWPKNRATGNTKTVPIDRSNDAIKALGYYLVDQFGHDIARPNVMAMEAQRLGHIWHQRGMRGGMLSVQ